MWLFRYYHLKERIVECEQVILRTFVFDVSSSHPYAFSSFLNSRYVFYLNSCKFLKLPTDCIQCGWSILLDSYLYHIQERYDSNTLAIAAIYLSLQMQNQPVSRNEWWTLFDIKYSQLYKWLLVEPMNLFDAVVNCSRFMRIREYSMWYFYLSKNLTDNPSGTFPFLPFLANRPFVQQTLEINGTDRASTIAAIITIIRMQHLRLRFFFASLIDSSRCLFASFTRADALEIYSSTANCQFLRSFQCDRCFLPAHWQGRPDP